MNWEKVYESRTGKWSILLSDRIVDEKGEPIVNGKVVNEKDGYTWHFRINRTWWYNTGEYWWNLPEYIRNQVVKISKKVINELDQYHKEVHQN